MIRAAACKLGYCLGMYDFGLSTPDSMRHLHKTLDLIVHLEDEQTHGWINRSPGEQSEIAQLARVVPSEPVDLVSSLRTAGVSALESLSHVRWTIEQENFILGPFRGAMRTALMGAGRLGFVALPSDAQQREENATTIVSQEAKSLGQAIADIQKISTLDGLRWSEAEVRSYQEQIARLNLNGLKGDRAMIRETAGMIGDEVQKAHPGLSGVTFRDHLTWIWHTSSGSTHGYDWQARASGDFVTDIFAVASALHMTLAATARLWG